MLDPRHGDVFGGVVFGGSLKCAVCDGVVKKYIARLLPDGKTRAVHDASPCKEKL